ncbi:MAG: recombination regulator RecX [Oscillospiraceae bacterium]|nr:recombination regulator RecX [Oscillospiraceae bacterium]
MNPEAKARALSLLDRRDYSRKMLIDKLCEKAISTADAEEVADWLCSLRVVDDSRYAGIVVRHYAAKGYGKKRIEQELYRRGIAKELWDAALEEMPEQESALDKLLQSRLRGDFSPESRKKAAAAAQRRGYGWEEIRSAMERLQSEDDIWMN